MNHQWSEAEEAVIANTGITVLAFPDLRANLVQSAAAQLGLPLSKVRDAVRSAVNFLTGTGSWGRASKRLQRLLTELTGATWTDTQSAGRWYLGELPKLVRPGRDVHHPAFLAQRLV